ncbi:MAG: PleD family two-component system response regulator [Promethearchaeota archaeon]
MSKDTTTITAYIDFKNKLKLDNWIKQHNYKMTKLIIDSIEFYTENYEFIKSGQVLYHKIKQILTPIKGYIQMAKESCPIDSKETLQFLDDIDVGYKSLEKFFKNYYASKNSEDEEYDILYIEDDPPTIRMITKHVERNGYTIKSLTSAEKCLEELEHSRIKPKLFLLDISLSEGGKEGIDLCKNLKNDENYQHLPIVLISAIISNNKEEIKKIKAETKADYIITKPFNFENFNKIFKFISEK